MNFAYLHSGIYLGYLLHCMKKPVCGLPCWHNFSTSKTDKIGHCDLNNNDTDLVICTVVDNEHGDLPVYRKISISSSATPEFTDDRCRTTDIWFCTRRMIWQRERKNTFWGSRFTESYSTEQRPRRMLPESNCNSFSLNNKRYTPCSSCFRFSGEYFNIFTWNLWLIFIYTCFFFQ